MNHNQSKINTKIGVFNVGMPSIEFSCRENPGIVNGEGTKIISCLTKVVFEYENDVKEEIAPVVIESCMNPGKKEIVPVTYYWKKSENKFVVSNSYITLEIENKNAYKKIYTAPCEPGIKPHSCSECTNCGRC